MTEQENILLINGPNLNLLDKREAIYGGEGLDQIALRTKNRLKHFFPHYLGQTEWFQSNLEGEIVERIQAASADSIGLKGLVINPAGYTHSSVAIYDALLLLSASVPVIEVHLSQIHQREEFRQNRITSKAAKIVIEGAGEKGYFLAICALLLE